MHSIFHTWRAAAGGVAAQQIRVIGAPSAIACKGPEIPACHGVHFASASRTRAAIHRRHSRHVKRKKPFLHCHGGSFKIINRYHDKVPGPDTRRKPARQTRVRHPAQGHALCARDSRPIRASLIAAPEPCTPGASSERSRRHVAQIVCRKNAPFFEVRSGIQRI